MWTCRGGSSTSRPKQRIFQHMTGIWWHRIHPRKQNLPATSRALSSTTQLRNHSRHIYTPQSACGLLPGCKPQDKVERRPLSPGAPASTSNPSPARATLQLPTIASVVKGGRGGRKKERESEGEKEILTAPLSRIKRAERGWREVLGTACTAGLDQTERVPLRAPLPPRPGRGEGRPRPLSEGPVSPGPARGPGAGGRPAATAGGPPRGEGCRRTPRNNKLQKNKRNFPNAAPATQDKCTNTHSLTHTRARRRQQPQL